MDAGLFNSGGEPSHKPHSVFSYLDAFNPGFEENREVKRRYQAGKVGDVERTSSAAVLTQEPLTETMDRTDLKIGLCLRASEAAQSQVQIVVRRAHC